MFWGIVGKLQMSKCFSVWNVDLELTT